MGLPVDLMGYEKGADIRIRQALRYRDPNTNMEKYEGFELFRNCLDVSLDKVSKDVKILIVS